MARSIHVRGIVQGVGFRPFVYRLAHELGISGWVLNAVDGVHIFAQGTNDQLKRMIEALDAEAPSAAQVSRITWSEVPNEDIFGFFIKTSTSKSSETTLVSPDLASCPDCLRELFATEDRRFHYPFINCTNCGPRFTIIEHLPYDRKHTTMSEFEMCESCAGEYNDPLNRRFHAQPNACFECGPYVELVIPEQNFAMRGTNREQSDALIDMTVSLLCEGKILAIKALGGYHLVCDATNPEAVQSLRTRKQRPRKPLAIMLKDIQAVRERFKVNESEEALLMSPAAPIVLLQNKSAEECVYGRANEMDLAYEVSAGVFETGVMLPATPLQHLLMQAANRPLVMTSGNISEEPIIGEDALAQELLKEVADAFLINNRRIVSRYDDSVVRVLSTTQAFDKNAQELQEKQSVVANARELQEKQGFRNQTAPVARQESNNTSGDAHTLQFVRRARGYAPRPLELPTKLKSTTQVLAVGPEQKNTFCLTQGSNAFISQHLGDLENAHSFANQLQTIELYEQLFGIKPTMLACDMHPEYLSTKWAHEHSEQTGLPLLEVQHHHAHIAAVLAEHSFHDEVIGIALDGTGYGTDESLWGGELIIASLQSMKRFAHLEPFALPGAAQAIKHPLRAAYALLVQHGLTEHPAAALVKEKLGESKLKLIEQMLAQGLNAPLSSSAGRLFDAISALLGICDEASYEGEPAVLLEAALCEQKSDASSKEELVLDLPDAREFTLVDVLEHENGTPAQAGTAKIISTRTLVLRILNFMQQGISRARISQYFHEQLMHSFVQAALVAREETNINTVALSGGVFNNRFLASNFPAQLREQGFEVLTHLNLPPNDGCIAYGQAAVALASLGLESTSEFKAQLAESSDLSVPPTLGGVTL